MKKFISFVALATLLFSAIGCREAEQISDFSENQNLKFAAKTVNDSANIQTNAENNTKMENTPKDPPVKDGHNW